MDVPEDILDEAEAITAKLSDIWLWDSLKREEATRIIAQALLSERLAQKERDAEIVQPFTVTGGQGGAFVRKAAWSILDAIRQS